MTIIDYEPDPDEDVGVSPVFKERPPLWKFVMVSRQLAEDGTVSPLGKAVYMAIARNADDEHSSYPNVKTLMQRCGCSESTVKRAMKELVGRGYLTVTERKRDNGSYFSNLYTLVENPARNVDKAPKMKKRGFTSDTTLPLPVNPPPPTSEPTLPLPVNPLEGDLLEGDLREGELPAQNKFALIDPPPVRVDNLPAVFKAGPVASAPKLWDVTHEAVIKSWPYTQTDPVTAAFTTEIMKVAKRSGQDPVTLVRVAECVMRLHGTTKLSALTKPARAALMARIDALAAVAHGHRPETIQKRWDALARNPDPRFPTEFGARLQRLIDQWDTDPTTTPTRTPNTASYRMAAIADKFRANTQNTEIIPMQQLSTRPRQ